MLMVHMHLYVFICTMGTFKKHKHTLVYKDLWLDFYRFYNLYMSIMDTSRPDFLLPISTKSLIDLNTMYCVTGIEKKVFVIGLRLKLDLKQKYKTI